MKGFSKIVFWICCVSPVLLGTTYVIMEGDEEVGRYEENDGKNEVQILKDELTADNMDAVLEEIESQAAEEAPESEMIVLSGETLQEEISEKQPLPPQLVPRVTSGTVPATRPRPLPIEPGTASLVKAAQTEIPPSVTRENLQNVQKEMAPRPSEKDVPLIKGSEDMQNQIKERMATYSEENPLARLLTRPIGIGRIFRVLIFFILGGLIVVILRRKLGG